jgi:hypothetical protein
MASGYLTGLTQYRGSGHGALRGSALITSSDPPGGFTDHQVAAFIDAQLSAGTVPGPAPATRPCTASSCPPGSSPDSPAGPANTTPTHAPGRRSTTRGSPTPATWAASPRSSPTNWSNPPPIPTAAASSASTEPATGPAGARSPTSANQPGRASTASPSTRTGPTRPTPASPPATAGKLRPAPPAGRRPGMMRCQRGMLRPAPGSLGRGPRPGQAAHQMDWRGSRRGAAAAGGPVTGHRPAGPCQGQAGRRAARRAPGPGQVSARAAPGDGQRWSRLQCGAVCLARLASRARVCSANSTIRRLS